MRVLVATDAWHPQVNGVVRTLMSLAKSARELGVPISFLTPESFPSLRCALPARGEIAQRIERARPNAIHIAKDVQTGLVWFTKILTDPFHDIKLYHKAPFYLMRGELIDPQHAQHRHG